MRNTGGEHPGRKNWPRRLGQGDERNPSGRREPPLPTRTAVTTKDNHGVREDTQKRDSSCVAAAAARARQLDGASASSTPRTRDNKHPHGNVTCKRVFGAA